jgi:hypothetical protein
MMNRTTLQCTDQEIAEAMQAVKADDSKPVRLNAVQRAEDIYRQQASQREKEAFRRVWEKIFQLIDQRWQNTRNQYYIPRQGLFASPAALIDRVVKMRMAWKGRDAESYQNERVDLIMEISERLMLQNFRSFIRKHQGRKTDDGLGNAFTGFMYSALCYRLLNMQYELRQNLNWRPEERAPEEEREAAGSGKKRRKTKMEQRWFTVHLKSLQEIRGNTLDDEGEPQRYEDSAADERSIYRTPVIYVEEKGSELPIMVFPDEQEMKEFHRGIVLQIVGKKKQLALFEYHMLLALDQLEIEPEETIKQYIMREMAISSNDYDVNMTRLRGEIMKYVKTMTFDRKGGDS